MIETDRQVRDAVQRLTGIAGEIMITCRSNHFLLKHCVDRPMFPPRRSNAALYGALVRCEVGSPQTSPPPVSYALPRQPKSLRR